MSFVRRLARPLLASSFIISGVERLRDADSTVHLNRALELSSKAVPQLESFKGQEKLVGQVIAGTQVVAGTLFALGKFPRLSSVTLLGTGILNAYVEYQATEANSSEERASRRRHALTNGSLLGAIAIAAVDRDGNPSLAWRANQLSEKMAKKSEKISADVRERTEEFLNN
ncbi:DoxX family protein [Rothia sp. P6271]|uniref:DoxX family protein n=1 Tax=unclassified Rothia (in: high G+C Gram-positive bacteria) TaxID=2689056 RepID=UPI003AC6D433